MNTKKLLVAYNESKPNAETGDFLAVVFEEMIPTFFGLKTHRAYVSGQIAYIGREITEKDIFAKLVDTGRSIENIDKTLTTLTSYLQQLKSFKIGNVVTVVPQQNDVGFELVKIAEIPKPESTKLP